MKEFTVDKLNVKVFENRRLMGAAAARDIAAQLKELAARREELSVIFAAAPSQNEVLAALAADTSIPWHKVNAFHMDEYIGLSPDAPQGFGNFLRARLFDLVPFRSVHLIDMTAKDPEAEAERYARLLQAQPIDVVVMGIGENGHIAFNDPPVADFRDPKTVKAVKLDEVCRRQQVNDGCFAALSDVPTHALTLTVPMLVSAPRIFCIVPAATKANAVFRTLNGEISERCPASVLRRHEHAVLYLDENSSKELSL